MSCEELFIFCGGQDRPPTGRMSTKTEAKFCPRAKSCKMINDDDKSGNRPKWVGFFGMSEVQD